MSSEIGNKGLLRMMAEALNILDVKQSPSRLNTDNVQATYELGRLNAAKYSLARRTVGGLDVTGTSQRTQSIFGTTTNGAVDPLFENAGRPGELVGISAVLEYTAAGALADNNVVLAAYMTRYANYGSLEPHDVIDLELWSVVVTARTYYVFALGGYSFSTPRPEVPFLLNNHVPAGDHLSISIYRPNGGVWPAGTIWNVRAVAFFDGPVEQSPWVPPS